MATLMTTMGSVVRVLIVDDHEVVREGLLSLLGNDESIDVVGAVGSGAEALRFVNEHEIDLAVVDLRLSDMRGEDLCAKLARQASHVRVVVLSTYLSEEAVRASLDAGASAYVSKSSGLKALRDTVARVAAGGRDSPDSARTFVAAMVGEAAARAGEVRSTPQQSRVLRLAADGLTNKEIGTRLFISESTVRFHVQKLKDLTGAKTRSELIAKAIRGGMISPHSEDPYDDMA